MPARSRLLPLLVSAALLAACSTSEDAPTDTVPTAAAAGADAPSSTVGDKGAALIELGEFNAEDEGFVLFDPCTEIPREVLDEAGFGDMVSEPSYLPSGITTCMFHTSDDASWDLLYMTAGTASRQQIIDLDFMIADHTESEIPDLYLHHMGEDTENACTAAVTTKRGRWSVEFTGGRSLLGQAGMDQAWEREEICARATDYLEKIYFQLGE